MTKLIHWNGVDIPDELRSLPAGTYVLESTDDALTEDEERGIAEALAAIRAGRASTTRPRVRRCSPVFRS